ncbi:hydroxyisourate hydrolase [Salinispirillum sp. LH 10-3-1]|uniref:5-hydroxyisourate hydrolase n=1 Tax=Salinispirillum sp. LH 10-3-1 TaxID=2952525 RepID=A0AB38YIF8_9GAMM
MSTQKSPITTHVLDTVTGRPAADLAVTLAKQSGGEWHPIAAGRTNSDGRIIDWLAGEQREAGTYRVEFATGDWLTARQRANFYPTVSIVFTIDNPDEHYHIPLLLSDFGYSTYRGS